MTEGTWAKIWSAKNSRPIVEELIRNLESPYWAEYRETVTIRVKIKAKNLPEDQYEDIVQDIMQKISRSLQSFHCDSSLKTWSLPIIEHCIIDRYRAWQHQKQLGISLEGSMRYDQQDAGEYVAYKSTSAEDVYQQQNDLKEAIDAMVEYADRHTNSMRNRKILQLVIAEGKSYKEAAIAAGCSAPVVGYVIRQAQDYARLKMKGKE